MRELLRGLLRWLDARLFDDSKTFPVYRSEDGDVSVYADPQKKTGELIFASFLETAPALNVFEKERFRVSVLEGTCGEPERPCFWLDCQFRHPEGEEWQPLLMLPESKLPVMQEVLKDTADFIAAVRGGQLSPRVGETD